MSETAPGERIAKIMARAGLCSRREAEQWVLEGRVRLDGNLLSSPAVNVRPGQSVTVDGEPLRAAEPPRVFRFHKPAGIMTTAHDPEGRTTIYDRLPADLPRLMPVGRLDYSSEGLLLMTNDGELKRRLELPATGWLRRYRVRVYGTVEDDKLAKLANGITIDGLAYGPIQAKLDRVQGANAWLTLALREGKNREVRRVMEHFGWPVNRLIRIAYGPFQLGNLVEGGIEEVKPKVLNEQLGIGTVEPVVRERPKTVRTPARTTAPGAKVAPARIPRARSAVAEPAKAPAVRPKSIDRRKR